MKKLKNKINIQFTLLILLAVAILGLTISGLILLTSNDLLSTIFVIVAVGLLIALLTIKSKLDYYKHEYSLLGLLETKEGPIQLKNKILDQNYIDHLTKNLNYLHFKSNNSYSMYYKVEKTPYKSRKHKTLQAIIIYKADISFIDQTSSNAFESLEKHLYKKEKYRERFFFQFKSINEKFSEKLITDADQIFFLNQRQNNIVVLNVLYNTVNNQAYYLRSSSFKPINILNEATNELNKLIKY